MIKDNVIKVKAEVEQVCKSLGRDPQEITLIGVTKTASVGAIQEAIDAGIGHAAENRVQEAEAKFPLLLAKNPKLTTHIIGHLQTNKVKDAIKVAQLIQSVDSLKLANEIEKQAAKIDKTVNILVQFNTAREEQKFGAAPEEAIFLIDAIAKLPHVQILGLMCMAPYTEDQGIIRKTFSDLRGIRDSIIKQFGAHPRVQMKFLSMGMSSDYKIALEEGSNMIRVGSAIFSATGGSASGGKWYEKDNRHYRRR